MIGGLEEVLVKALEGNPSSSVLVMLAAAYWIRKELGERNGSNPTRIAKKLAESCEMIADSNRKITSLLDEASEERRRLHDTARRVESRLDSGVCHFRGGN